MTSTQQKGISCSRISDQSAINIDYLECSICRDLLWKPVACQTCETPFCSACIFRWFVSNPNKCPNQCKTYIERKCPPFIAKLLAQLQIACFYQSNGCQQVISYEALDKHEIECDYQPHQCPGCQLQMLKKDFVNHERDCALIELTCHDCKLAYKKDDAATKHTENICLREQVRQLSNECIENKLKIQKLTDELDEIRTWRKSMLTEVRITFDDLPSAAEACKNIPATYKGLKWISISYMHQSFGIKNYPASGYVTSFTPGCGQHVAFFKDEVSISTERPLETFTLVSLLACAAWNDDLQLTITGYRNSTLTYTHTTKLLFGKPQLILLQWKNIDKVILKSSGGTPHPATGISTGATQVVLTQLTID